MQTTLNATRNASPCEEGWRKLLNHLGKTKADDASFSVAVILDSNGLDDTLWVLAHACGEFGERICHEFACDAAERVLHLYETRYPEDHRPRRAIEVKRAWLRGEATDADAAWDAAVAAWAARDAADAELAWQVNRLRELLQEAECV